MTPPCTVKPPLERPVLLLIGIMLIAMNLRAPFTGIAPLLETIQGSLQLGTTEAGMLITLPLLAFATVSPFSALLGREYGLERTLFIALVIIALGIGLRSQGSVWALYLGTWIIGGGIAIGNVLLPSLLKRDFPQRIAMVTTVYALTMGIAAAIGSAGAIPLNRLVAMDWRLTLGAMLILPVLAALVWFPQLASRSAPSQGTPTPPHGGRVWHSWLAWQVTLFFGINSFVYYVIVSWLPMILQDNGYSAEQAGSLHGLLQLATAVPGLLLMPILSKLKDQRLAATSAATLSLMGLLGLLLTPSWATAWIILIGLGTGAGIIVGLTFVALRATTATQAAALSGMAQCIGYLLAATGPTLIGGLHDALGGWNITLILCAILCLIMATFGLLAGRDIHIDAPATASVNTT